MKRRIGPLAKLDRFCTHKKNFNVFTFSRAQNGSRGWPIRVFQLTISTFVVSTSEISSSPELGTERLGDESVEVQGLCPTALIRKFL